jgi:diguanylate cyclase (GGDEF)-like protein
LDYELNLIHRRNRLIVRVLWVILIYDIVVNFTFYASSESNLINVILLMGLVGVPLLSLVTWLVRKRILVNLTMYLITLSFMVVLFILNSVEYDAINLYSLLFPPIISAMYKQWKNILFSVAGSFAIFCYYVWNNGEQYFVNWMSTDIFYYFMIYLALGMTMLLDSRLAEKARLTALDNEQKAKEEKLESEQQVQRRVRYLAYHDALTGLPNRNFFYEALEGTLETSRREGKKFALMYLDLDNFKQVNDSMGHYFGDKFLKVVANQLGDLLQGSGSIFRLGGDEFVIIVQDKSSEGLRRLAEELLSSFEQPIFLNGQPFYTSPSIGISEFPKDGEDVGTIISNADLSMYYAKKQGKNNFHFYTDELKDMFESNNKIESGLRNALAEQQLVLYYQPIVDLATGSLKGMEALIRWKHPERGFIPPSEFIPIAEQSDLIVRIGKWVMYTACKQNKEWQVAGYALIPISVNVSLRQFYDKDFLNSVTRILEETELDPSYLHLEITESIVHDIETSRALIHQLKKLGIHISIDDFGTGYSSFSVLHQLPIDCLKIDRSFISDLTTNPVAEAVAKTIIDMGKNLKFDIVAEGIEQVEQVQILKKNGCFSGQGYFYSKPVSAGETEAWFQQRKAAPNAKNATDKILY